MKAHFGTRLWLWRQRLAQAAVAAIFGLALSGPAHAVDGCKLLLCMAGSWQSISQCTPTVREALRDLMRGRAWPTCGMAGGMGGGSASANQFVSPEQCPGQYITAQGNDESGRPILACPFMGVIHVAVQGQPWSRTWWSLSGDAVIEWLPAARAAMVGSPGGMDGRFDRDRAAWLVGEQARLAAQVEAEAAAAGAPGGGE